MQILSLQQNNHNQGFLSVWCLKNTRVANKQSNPICWDNVESY